MDGKKTSERLSGPCTGNGATAPGGARVAELVWSRVGPSGAMAWDLISGGKAAQPGILVGVFAQAMTDRPRLTEEVRRGFERAQERMAWLNAATVSQSPYNLVLDRLREIRALLGDVREDTADTRLRVGMLDAGYASISLRLDRLAGDVKRIKRRLSLVETP